MEQFLFKRQHKLYEARITWCFKAEFSILISNLKQGSRASRKANSLFKVSFIKYAMPHSAGMGKKSA